MDPVQLALLPGIIRPVPESGNLIVNLTKTVDLERVERRFAETVADLGLMDADSTLVADIDRRLAEITNEGDGYRAGLARYAIDLLVIMDGADWSGYGGEPLHSG